jgi:hypothetical protein
MALIENREPLDSVRAKLNALLTQFDTWGSDIWVAKTRAELVADVAAGRLDDLADGAVVFAGDLVYRKQAGATMFADLPGLVYVGTPRPEHHTENTVPGTTDMTAALQWCLDQNRVALLQPVTYNITTQLLIDPQRNRDVGFYCLDLASRYPENQQPGGPSSWADCRILYSGPPLLGEAPTAMIAASAEPVGVEPSNGFQDTIWGVKLHNLTLDCDSKAGFGFYGARVQQVDFVGLNVTGATVAGWSLNGTYSGRTEHCKLYRNPGRGGEEGYADVRWGWTVQDKTNALIHYNLHAEANGGAAEFRESDAALRSYGCGYYWGPHRGGAIFGITSENNYGANIVFAPTSAGNFIHAVYTELGCKFLPSGAGSDAISQGHAAQQIGLIFEGAAAAQNCGIRGGVLAGDHIVLTGTEPTAARRESAFEIADIALAPSVIAGWGNYRLVNCQETVITGTAPAGAMTLQGGLQFGPGLDVLNVYDTGTFTPAVVGSTTAGAQTHSVQSGNYTRIGNRVFFDISLVVSGTDGAAAGAIRVTGLPFAAAGTNSLRYSVSISDWLGLTSEVAGGQIFGGTDYITINRAVAGKSEAINATEISATTRLYISGNYRV